MAASVQDVLLLVPGGEVGGLVRHEEGEGEQDEKTHCNSRQHEYNSGNCGERNLS